jgi:short subunit fatty acids transporter
MRQELYRLTPLEWALLAVLLLSQSIWLFRDAQKRNAKPWLWGFWGLLNFPTPLIVYLILIRKVFRSKK